MNHSAWATEKSATHRDTDAFFFWFFLDLLGNQEKCNIRNLRAWDFQSLQKARTLLISDDDKVSSLEEFSERHFVFHLFDLERDTKIHDRRTSETSYLGTEVPLVDERAK